MKCPNKANHIGERFGNIVIVRQYLTRNKWQSVLKVDYICDCGNTTFNKSYQKVKKQRICLKCRKTNAHKINPNTSFSMLFSDYRRNAPNRNIQFILTSEEFRQMTVSKCFYCGIIPSSVKRPNCSSGEYIYNGIDRKDNTNGYTMNNCVPCCKLCNFAKYTMTYGEFLNHIKRIYDYQFVENKR